MINSINTIQNIYRIHKTEATSNKADKTDVLKGKGISGDELAISSESRLKQKALLAIKQAEDIRGDKVDEFSQKIATGTYTVADDEVAERIVTDSLLDIVL